MSIFPHREHWRDLLTLLSDDTLTTTAAKYQTMVSVLESRLDEDDVEEQTKLMEVLCAFQAELAEVHSERSRRGLVQTLPHRAPNVC